MAVSFDFNRTSLRTLKCLIYRIFRRIALYTIFVLLIRFPLAKRLQAERRAYMFLSKHLNFTRNLRYLFRVGCGFCCFFGGFFGSRFLFLGLRVVFDFCFRICFLRSRLFCKVLFGEHIEKFLVHNGVDDIINLLFVESLFEFFDGLRALLRKFCHLFFDVFVFDGEVLGFDESFHNKTHFDGLCIDRRVGLLSY